MSLKIRLARAGAKKRPYYRIVVADSRSPRDGRYIEKIGTYDPLLPKGSAERVKLVEERVKHWLGHGALPTDRVLQIPRRGRTANARRAVEPDEGRAGQEAHRARGGEEDRRRGEGQGRRRGKEGRRRSRRAPPPPAEEPVAEPEVQAEPSATE